MKILRCYKGFTTNSSAASEWVPPPDLTQPEPDTSSPDNAADTTGNAGNTATKSANTTNAANSGQKGEESITPVVNNATVERVKAREEAFKQRSMDNVVILTGFVLSVLGVFLIERLIRRLLAARSSEND